MGARRGGARRPVPRRARRSPTPPTRSFRISRDAWARTAGSSAVRRSSAALSHPARRSRALCAHARARRANARGAASAAFVVRLPRARALTPMAEPRTTFSRRRAAPSRSRSPSSRADAARGHDRVPALPHRRHLRGRLALAARSAHRGARRLQRGCSRGLRPGGRETARRATGSPPSVAPHAGYRELMAETSRSSSTPSSRSRPRRVDADPRRTSSRSADGMARSSRARATARSSSTTIPDLQDYCYVVAGIVGEMLTELFLLGRRLSPRSRPTCASAPRPSARRSSSSTS